MGLVKMKIVNVDSSEELEVLFNPSEYTLEKKTPWREHEIPGLDLPSVEFVAGERMVLSMDLFFDTTDDRSDARDHVDKLIRFAHVSADLHRPPILMIVWGEALNFKGVLENIRVRYTMFLDDGTPVRAVASVVFRQYKSPEEQLQEAPRESADHTKRRIVREGDTLQLIAAREYHDAGQWRRIARANRIEDPLTLKPGQELVIPPMP